MEYTLMHKNTPVIDIGIDEDTGGIIKILNPYCIEHLPVGINMAGNQPDRKALNNWWTSRAIPASRSGLREALLAMNVSSPELLLTKCFGLSLSDQYWICLKDNPMEWKNINFFENEFSEDVGNALFGKNTDGELNLMSPDNTSDGWLKKKWVIADGKRLLIKSGSGPFYQEPLNEVLAASIAKRLGIPHTPYSIIWDDGRPYSVCADFVSVDKDLVSAWQISQTEKKDNQLSGYQHFILCCNNLGVSGMEHCLNQMLVLDYLIANSDRHYNNFGAVRNVETLEWLGAAPVFDCGTSMWHEEITQMIQPGADAASKPFRSRHSEQVKLVTDFSWIDFTALHGIEDEYAEILRPSPYIDDVRRNTLCNAIKTRVKMMKNIAVK